LTAQKAAAIDAEEVNQKQINELLDQLASVNTAVDAEQRAREDAILALTAENAAQVGQVAAVAASAVAAVASSGPGNMTSGGITTMPSSPNPGATMTFPSITITGAGGSGVTVAPLWSGPIRILLLGRAGIGKTSLVRRMVFGTFDEDHQYANLARFAHCPTVHHLTILLYELHSPTLKDHFPLDIDVDGTKCPCILQDSAGMASADLTKLWLRDCDAVILTFDITNQTSFNDLAGLYDHVVSVRQDRKEKESEVATLRRRRSVERRRRHAAEVNAKKVGAVFGAHRRMSIVDPTPQQLRDEDEADIPKLDGSSHMPVMIVATKMDAKRPAVKDSQPQMLAKLWQSEYRSSSARTGHNVRSLFTQIARLVRAGPPILGNMPLMTSSLPSPLPMSMPPSLMHPTTPNPHGYAHGHDHHLTTSLNGHRSLAPSPLPGAVHSSTDSPDTIATSMPMLSSPSPDFLALPRPHATT
jgi:GTPase SAR1 family protein